MVIDTDNVINFSELLMLDNDDSINEKTFAATLNRQWPNKSISDCFGWFCWLMNWPINNNQTSIKHVTAGAIYALGGGE